MKQYFWSYVDHVGPHDDGPHFEDDRVVIYALDDEGEPPFTDLKGPYHTLPAAEAAARMQYGEIVPLDDPSEMRTEYDVAVYRPVRSARIGEQDV